ncbi:two pore segment channel 3 [Erpetoichthys calabaricus]|uniref:two pore segment channel 3 n=1 Tax=Erpetoichthys calabaricus TaxID=27687 RepID=UPI00223418BF|nr:two pore segment channel 3 [Erpetoichthys calabaricus]
MPVDAKGVNGSEDVITVESSTVNGRNRAEQHPSKTKLQFETAATYVSDAQYNRNVPFEKSPESIRLYKLYNHWAMRTITYTFIIVDLALALFEEPAVFLLPIWATSLAEFVCLLVFTGRLVHYAKVIPPWKFWKDAKNICIMVIILLTLIDMIIYGSLKMTGYYGVRWSRVLRPLFLVNITEGRLIRRSFRSIRNTLTQVLYVFLLFLFSILMFSLMGLKLFGKRNFETSDGKPYFTNYLDILFDMYVLVTTANSPDVMMPAYDFSVWFSVFFILFIVVNTYIFMSVFLAVVYNNYKKHLKDEVKKLVRVKRYKMVKAFEILKVLMGNEYVIMQSDWNQLVRMVDPSISSSHRELLWSVSDDSQNGYIGKFAFIQLSDLLNIKVITLKSRVHPLKMCLPRLYSSAASRVIRHAVQHKAFVFFYDFIILVNAIFIGLDEENSLLSSVEWVFLGFYLLEIVLKLYTYEPRSFFARHQFWNWFDTTVIIAALLATIINMTLISTEVYNSREVLDIVFILRVLRLIRIVDSIKRFRAIINTLINIGPTMINFGQLILVVYYIFAVIGMEVFKNKIKFYNSNSSEPLSEFCGNDILKDSAFVKSKYCKNNFNNIVSSFILLLELTVVNQWHVLATGFTMVTHVAARTFFVVFHIIVVIIIINIFIAFVLEAFFVEYTVEKCDLQTSIEKKIQELDLGVQEDHIGGSLVDDMETHDNEVDSSRSSKSKSLMFKIASQRYRTVDALLQRMFEADLSPDDNGCSTDDENELDNLPPDFTFNNPGFNSA